jgi:acyl carrier protein
MSDINEENTELETRLQDLGINSENYVKMGIELEEVFGITLTLQELDHQNNMFETVQSIVDFVTEKLSNEH